MLSSNIEINPISQDQEDETASSSHLLKAELLLKKIIEQDTSSTAKLPTIFTRIPIFIPTRSRNSKDTDWVKGEIHKTSWGVIKRIGPGLDIYDEDTLIGLLRTATQKELQGKRSEMPVPVPRILEDGFEIRKEGHEEEIIVYCGQTSAFNINSYLGRDTGGKCLEQCRNSIRRLSLTNLFFLSDKFEQEGKIHLFDYVGSSSFKGSIWVQFSPLIVRLLQSYTWIDMNIRRELTDIGKTIHKFLSGQDKIYCISMIKLMTTVGFQGEFKTFMHSAKIQLQKLETLGWLKYEITGNGRKKPYVLHICRGIPKHQQR